MRNGKSENIFIAIFSSTLNAEQNLRVLSLRNNQFRSFVRVWPREGMKLIGSGGSLEGIEIEITDNG